MLLGGRTNKGRLAGNVFIGCMLSGCVAVHGQSDVEHSRAGGLRPTIINVSEYGAKCDGNTDDAEAFQAAHDNARYGGTILIPPGVCVLGRNINVTKHNMKFRGSGQGATYLKMGPSVTKLFNVVSQTAVQLVLPEFSDFSVDGGSAPRAVAFYIKSARSIHIERVYTTKCYISYFLDHDATRQTHTFHLSKFTIEDTPDQPGAVGILLNGGGDDWFIRDGRLFQNSQSRVNIGIELRSGGGFLLDTLDISQYGRAFVADPPAGTVVRFGQINSLQCDTSWGDNATLDGTAAFASGYPNGVYDLNFVNSWFSSAGVHGGDGNGLNIISAKGIVVDSSQIYSNSLNGIRIHSGARNITLAHSHIGGNSDGAGNHEANPGRYSGIAVDRGSESFSLNGNTSGVIGYLANTQNYGAFIDADCKSYLVIGNDFTHNLSGPYKDLSLNVGHGQVFANLPAEAVPGSASGSNGVRFKNLGTPQNGAFIYCLDCSRTPVCGGGGKGAFAKRLDGAWICN